MIYQKAPFNIWANVAKCGEYKEQAERTDEPRQRKRTQSSVQLKIYYFFFFFIVKKDWGKPLKYYA